MNIGHEYIRLKNYLFVVAYNMVGEVGESEDIVQDAFEDVLRQGNKEINNHKSFLTRIVVNKSIDRLSRLKKARENYPNTWLPEPFVTESVSEEHADILPYAFLYLLEELNPIDRAVFILRESFDESYDNIAALCGISAENCRQILHRTKAKLQVSLQKSQVRHTQESSSLLQEFLNACISRDKARLESLLKADIELYSDGGGKVVAARKVLHGLSSVVKFIEGIIGKAFDKWSKARQVFVNNEPALLVPDEKGVYMLIMFSAKDGRFGRLFMMRNPDKIIL